MRSRRAPTRRTSSRSCGRPTTDGAAAPYLSEGRLQHARPVRQLLGAAARLHLGLRQARRRHRAELRRVRDVDAGAAARSTPTCPASKGRFTPSYPPFDLGSPTTRGPTSGSRSSASSRSDGKLPRLSIIRLGNDHTSGTRPGSPTPRAMVAENDLALGRIVEAISQSRTGRNRRSSCSKTTRRTARTTWTPTARVLLSSARSRAAARRQHALHDIGGAAHDGADSRPAAHEPVDAAATPMYAAFQATPGRGAVHALPARVSLDEKNDWSSSGRARLAAHEPRATPTWRRNSS